MLKMNNFHSLTLYLQIEHPELLILPLDATHSHLTHHYKIPPQHHEDNNATSGNQTATRQPAIDSPTESDTPSRKEYAQNSIPDIIRTPTPLREAARSSQGRDRNEYVKKRFRGRGHFENFEPDGQSSVRTRTQSGTSHRLTPHISARGDSSQTIIGVKDKSG